MKPTNHWPMIVTGFILVLILAIVVMEGEMARQKVNQTRVTR
jgi:hypothetical protein